MKFDIKYFKNLDGMDIVKARSNNCQEKEHTQQVAYSTYHNALTQICFTCKKIYTNLEEV